MPPASPKTVAVACPKCGHVQPEPRSAYSTRCKKCQEHFRVQEALRPAAAPAKTVIATRKVTCFQCGTELEPPAAAESTMCKRCSAHVDLADYHVAHTVSRNFRTHGRLIVEEKGYVLNTEAVVGEAILKGRLIGKLRAERTLEIHTSARIQGTLGGGVLVIPAGHCFRWADPLRVAGADIAGEFVGSLQSTGRVLLRASARFFGDIDSAGLVTEPGAVIVGAARLDPNGPAVSTAPAAPPVTVSRPAASAPKRPRRDSRKAGSV